MAGFIKRYSSLLMHFLFYQISFTYTTPKLYILKKTNILLNSKCINLPLMIGIREPVFNRHDLAIISLAEGMN